MVFLNYAIRKKKKIPQTKSDLFTFLLGGAESFVTRDGEPTPPLELLSLEKGRVGLGRAACRFCRKMSKLERVGNINCFTYCLQYVHEFVT